MILPTGLHALQKQRVTAYWYAYQHRQYIKLMQILSVYLPQPPDSRTKLMGLQKCHLIHVVFQVEQPNREMVTGLIHLNTFSCTNTTKTVQGISPIKGYIHESLD